MVTGASSGIGTAIARALAAHGVPLVLTARRTERLEALAAELRARVEVQAVTADLADPGAVAALVEGIETRGVRVRMLVNNAGYGVPGRFDAVDWTRHAAFLQVMVTAVCELTWRLLPSIRAFPDGRILNVASFAGLMPGSRGQTLYGAAKAFMIRFSESLAQENADRDLRVTALCPGFTRSEFHDVTGTRAMMDRLPAWAWLDADAVARAGLDALEQGRVIAIPGWRYRLLHGLTRHLSDQRRLALMARNASKIRRSD
ncbi:SDR family NAD(P)-dependent oxidoreductase [Luteimonas sp. SJ-16]|uniref:SDR family NAD(P)-dependent oxidoreductase n=1 Tax=Luteimonas deserti TaxID=2752306 RepID=A0A7Z0U109_9GAMM|nr:SDR family NAD(P)-dependent oxidoreductase [Luteimonas deserti]